MSRALDKGVEKALKHGNHEKVFEEIAGVLTTISDDGLLEIELLGQSHTPEGNTYLQDGNAVAIPKLRLIQAFIVARQVLMDHVRAVRDASRNVLFKSTAVILLMDPEHLTAANTRKRLLTDAAIDPETAREDIAREQYFIDSLLTSRLHRHTKSPTLWSHQRWLLERSEKAGLSSETIRDLREVVLVSGERHPRNYYAWCHARQLTKGSDTATLFAMLADTRRWCFAHHDDVSGWMFLVFLLEKAPKSTESTVLETLKLTELCRWRNESVWYFLRNLLVKEHVESRAMDEFQRVWGSMREGAGEGSAERRVLDQTMSWIETPP